MSATRALVAKELSQHGGALLGLSALLAVAWGLAQGLQAVETRRLSELQLVATFASWPLVAATVVLGHRLVVTELYARTQRFLEALPLRRAHVAGVKAAFGLCCVELWAFAILFASVAVADTEVVTLPFLGVMAARLAMFAFTLWAVVFALGFFGRLRVPLAVGGAFVLLMLDHHTIWELERFGPFALMDSDTFALERRQIPLRAMFEAAAVGVAALGLTAALARVREGSIVETLARPLGARELSALAVVGFAALTAAFSLEGEGDAAPPRFITDQVLREGPVEVAYFEAAVRPAAEAFTRALAPTLSAFARGLGLPNTLPVRVAHSADTPGPRPESLATHHERGLVMRMNLTADLPMVERVAFVLHQWVWAHTRGRAGVEPRHWLLDGFALHFAASQLPASGPDLLLMRARAAHQLLPVSVQSLAAYHITWERLGIELAESLAASGWRYLETRVGSERTWALARAAFTRAGTGDVRDFLHERRNPLAKLFLRSTGEDWAAFVAGWAASLAAAETLGPRARLEVRTTPEGSLSLVGEFTRPPVEGAVCTMLHQRLPPFDSPLDPDLHESVHVLWQDGRRIEQTIQGYGSGERAFIAFECEAPVLGCAVRLLAKRVTFP